MPAEDSSVVVRVQNLSKSYGSVEALRGMSLEMLALVVSGFIGLVFALKLFRWEKEERIATSAKVWSLVLVIPFVLIGLWMNTRRNMMASWAMTFNLADQASKSSNQSAKPAESKSSPAGSTAVPCREPSPPKR